MRRGLMKWNPQELPLNVLEARIAALRGAMKHAALDAFVSYTNLVRPSAVAHLTGFTPYWNEGLLLVPMTGRLVFATALSNRVADWIRSNNPVSEVTSSPRPGALLGERLAKDSVKRVGVLELDAMPAELFDHLSQAAPAVQWSDASALFAALRHSIDAVEQGLLARADALAAAALEQASAAGATDAGRLAGLIEKHARLGGAEEAYVAVAPNLAADRRFNRVSKPTRLAERFAVRASVAYKGSWVRRIRTFAKDDAAARADAWFRTVIGSLEAGQPIAAQLTDRLEALPGAKLENWTVESCLGSYPLEVVASSRNPGSTTLAHGRFAVLTIELLLDGGPWIGGAPLIVGRAAF